MRFLLPAVLLLTACNGEIYLRDGLTDGDTFYLAQQALTDDDPVLQSWVAYSLMLSTCKLAIGGENPARASSYDCELTARRHLLERWQEQRTADSNAYLDTLATVAADGWLDEYVAHYFHRKGWALPDGLDVAGFRQYRRTALRGHRPRTRITGSWNYARNVRVPY